MKLLLFEDDLMWTSRLAVAAKQLGHEPIVVRSLQSIPEGDIGIVNFHLRTYSPQEAVAELKSRGIKSIAHAGHKEKPLLQQAKEVGCDRIATNGELSHKLEGLLAELFPTSEQMA